jgi:peptidoglycan-N-acetylglucosamine deacetylase
LATEQRFVSELKWPSGKRLPIVLTFEHQSGEGAPPLPGDRPNFMVSGTMEYGGRTGIWKILELLDRFQIKATFFVCGATAEKYPQAVRAAQEAGHELAGMSYNFEKVRGYSTEREQSVLRRSSQALENVAGVKIIGWRCPDYRTSPQTLDLLAENGFTWDSSLLNDDLPYLFDCDGRQLVEIPFTTSTADKTFIGYPYPQRGGSDGLTNVWNNEFDMLYEESERASRLFILSLQTWGVGRPAPLRALKHFLERLSGHEELWFAKCSEIAEWSKRCLQPTVRS